MGRKNPPQASNMFFSFFPMCQGFSRKVEVPNLSHKDFVEKNDDQEQKSGDLGNNNPNPAGETTKGFENVTDDVFGLMIDKIKSTVKTIRDERLKEQKELEAKEKQRIDQEKELAEKRKELDAQQARQKEIDAELARKQKELDKANAEIATMQTQKSVVETLGMPLADMSSKETDIEKLIAYVEVLRNVKPPAITEPQFIQELAKMQATLLPWLDSILANLRQGK
jgi:multidrug efflux pump subunit AcrA (membrane-fusion protein)